MQYNYIIVTGGAGFIGSNIIEGLNNKGYDKIIVVDNLKDARKFKNIADLNIIDFIDKHDFIAQIQNDAIKFSNIRAVFHQGACSDTMEHNGQYMMQNNFTYSKILFDHCQAYSIPFFYASSAATYGNKTLFTEHKEAEMPLNIYGYSKLLFDNYVRAHLNNRTSEVVGFRYFNVYGPREFHKGKMASVALHHYQQFKQHGQVKLFGEYDGYLAGGHTRDFIYVGDVVKANLYMLEKQNAHGIFNLGTGRAEPFNNIATTIINNNLKTNHNLKEVVEKKLLNYIDFPDALRGKYQSFTQANLENLHKVADYNEDFVDVKQGVSQYYNWLENNYARFIE